MRETTSKENRYSYYKWFNLIAFSLLYNTVYIGRFNLNNVLPQVVDEFSLLPYQQTMLSSSVFIAYALGSLINGRIVDGSSPKRMIALGASTSILANLAVSFAANWQVILLLWMINGYFQSMIWVSGMCLISKWWSSRERGLAGGLANFASGLSHVTAYVVPVAIGALFPYLTWREKFALPMSVIAFFLVIFWFLVTDEPEQNKLLNYNEDNPKVYNRESYLKREVRDRHGNPWRYFFTRSKFLWWCAIALLSSLCRYGLLKWIPIYYMGEQHSIYILNPIFSNLILPLGMAIGTLILSWLTGKIFLQNKGLMIIGSAALCGTLVIIFPTMTSPEIILICIFCTGFFLYGINGILWIYAMDRGGRIYSGTTVGILNCFAYVGAALEAFIFPAILKITGQLLSIFILMELFCVAMIICGMIVSDKDTAFEVESNNK